MANLSREKSAFVPHSLSSVFFVVLNIFVVGFACDTTKSNCNRKSNGNRNGKNNRKVLRPKEGLRMTRRYRSGHCDTWKDALRMHRG